MPTARLLRIGDVMGHYISHLGWAGVRFGLTRSIDVGVGMRHTTSSASPSTPGSPRSVAKAWPALWWAYASVLAAAGGDSATTNFGFTWAHAGMGWITGPLVSVWGDRAGFHGGAHLAQRTGLSACGLSRTPRWSTA